MESPTLAVRVEIVFFKITGMVVSTGTMMPDCAGRPGFVSSVFAGAAGSGDWPGAAAWASAGLFVDVMAASANMPVRIRFRCMANLPEVLPRGLGCQGIGQVARPRKNQRHPPLFFRSSLGLCLELLIPLLQFLESSLGLFGQPQRVVLEHGAVAVKGVHEIGRAHV